jgi:hypothetical protein
MLAVWFVLAIALGTAADEPPRVNATAAALREFAERTQEYVALREKLTAQVPAVSSHATPEEIVAHQDALAAAVRTARQTARQGDIFTAPVVPQFRAIIRNDLRSRDVRDAMAALQEVPPTLSLRVNDRWPPDAPRATVPPRLLNNLQRLPDGLEYRFFGRHLVLLDSEANLVLDFISNVVPSVLRRR